MNKSICITDKDLRRRIKALSRKELEECVENICVYLYGKCEDEDGKAIITGWAFDGAPCDSGEELDMVQHEPLIESLVTP